MPQQQSDSESRSEKRQQLIDDLGVILAHEVLRRRRVKQKKKYQPTPTDRSDQNVSSRKLSE